MNEDDKAEATHLYQMALLARQAKKLPIPWIDKASGRKPRLTSDEWCEAFDTIDRWTPETARRRIGGTSGT